MTIVEKNFSLFFLHLTMLWDDQEDSDDCQFLFEELVKALTNEMYYAPCIKTIKDKLVEKYGDDVIISINKHNQLIVCFHHAG